MKCPSCEADVTDGARFCPRCGTGLAGVCRACGVAAAPGARFCAACGAALDDAAPGRTAASRPDAEHRQVTVVFADLVNSVALSTRLEPEELRRVLNHYQDCCAAVIRRFDGHVAKFLGDGVLAFFGVPEAHEDDAERAVHAGLAIVEEVRALRPDLDLHTRVGISTGLVVASDLAGGGHEVVGEPPNRAHRLQTLAEPDSVVVGPRTRRLLGELFACADLGVHAIKGFDEPARVWRVLGPSRIEDRFAALHGGRLTPLVGREHELALLLARWQHAADGEGQVVVLTGEPGIGKSRMVQALRERLAGEAPRTVRLQCLPYFRNSALRPVIEELERAAGIEREDDADAGLAKLGAHLDALGMPERETLALFADLLSIPMGDGLRIGQSLSPQQERRKTLDALVRRVWALAAGGPLLLIVEDVHWVDPTTRTWLEQIIDGAPERRVLIVLTSRPGVPLPRAGRAHLTALTLSRLSRRQTECLIARMTGDKPLPPDVVEHVVARTDGIPLFVEELTKTILESGVLEDSGDRFDLKRPLGDLAIPDTLQDSLTARLDRLGPDRDIVQIGAVIGREFPFEVLAAVAPISGERLRHALDRLVEAELLFCRGEPPDAVYSFKHALVQECAYKALLRERRGQLHERIARVLATDFPDILATSPELIAHHFTEAGLYEEAVEFWREAGETALARGAPREAAAHFANALRLLERFPETGPRARTELALQTALGGALIAARGFSAPETGEAFARAWTLCRRLEDETVRIPVLFGRWLFHIARAEVQDALEVADAMLEQAGARSDAEALLVAHRALADSWFFLGDLERARTHAERVVEQYQPDRHAALANPYVSDPFVVCVMFMAHCLLRQGSPAQARPWCERALVRARELGHMVTLAHALQHACLFHQLDRDPPAVQRHADELAEVAGRHGLPFWQALGEIFRGWALTETGQVAEGARALNEGIAAYRAASGRLYLPYVLAMWGDVCRGIGEPAEGLRAIAEAKELVRRTGVHGFEAHLHRVEGQLRLALPEPDAAAAEACFRRGIEVARRQGARLSELRAAVNLARLWHAEGRAADARDLLQPMCAEFADDLDSEDIRDARTALAEIAGA